MDNGWTGSMDNGWTHAHCERCYDAQYPRLITKEIWCDKHYHEAMNENAEEVANPEGIKAIKASLKLVSDTIRGHFVTERLMSGSSSHDFDNRQDHAQETWDAQDYRDATEGGCGFPWESPQDDPDAVADAVAKGHAFDLCHIAVALVGALAPASYLMTPEYWLAFLLDCQMPNREFCEEFVEVSFDKETGEFSY